MSDIAGKMDKACLMILSMGIDMKDTVRDAFQHIRNKQKNFTCASFLDIKKQLFPDKCRLGRGDRIGENLFRPIFPDADRQVDGFFRNCFTLHGNIGGI